MAHPSWNALEVEAENAKSLDELFQLWKEAHKAEENYEVTTLREEGIPQDSFIADGYISQENYAGVLFILKEANILKDEVPAGSEPFYRPQADWYRPERRDNSPKQKEKMGRMASYIRYHHIQNFQIALQQSAFLNLNKRGGGNHTHKKKLTAYTHRYAPFIQREIALLQPKQIICLGHPTDALVDKCHLNFIDEKRIFTVNMWHPAYRMKGIPRYPVSDMDQNVDAYMKEFIKRYNKINKC